MKIGFIGLGIMGRPMAKNLVAAGHDLVVLDRSADAVAELTALGATTAGTPREIAEQVDLVLTMLPNSPQVQEVVLGEDGVLSGARDGLLYADMSSIDPLVSRDVSDALAERGVAMLDAPVSGGEPMAVAGTLSFMVGGPVATFDVVQPVLAAMGKSVVRVGGIGAGNIAKLANQAVVAVNIAVVAEALVLAQKAGVDPEQVFEAIKGGLAGSNVMNAKAPLMLDHQFAPGFRINLHLKDLTNVMSTSHTVGAPMPLTAAVFELMTQLRAHGHEGEDHSALLRTYERAAGIELTRGEPS
ncbi:2-hydroxy-3-oxopropionate reductase [Cellulomonas triticagri]|uniref:2-hydroxy-3-oxopropionate reductase n=1 Tax=Cellulomonas triticagri TaxID=2483352 RepID=A0A3M2J9H6_9CELL|nr:2-hydroxy-3-oxopropionate reductase [Cellulomonas triticagri]RMI08796.1 2-hydroxy-3-oxopropionate reductase [Cellulomonas triticagri]